jgi:hypothetical protein
MANLLSSTTSDDLFFQSLVNSYVMKNERFLSLTLNDATTADAVLERLLGVEAFQARSGRPF